MIHIARQVIGGIWFAEIAVVDAELKESSALRQRRFGSGSCDRWYTRPEEPATARHRHQGAPASAWCRARRAAMIHGDRHHLPIRDLVPSNPAAVHRQQVARQPWRDSMIVNIDIAVENSRVRMVIGMRRPE